MNKKKTHNTSCYLTNVSSWNIAMRVFFRKEFLLSQFLRFIILMPFIFSIQLYSQQNKVDSLKPLIKGDKEDTLKVIHYLELTKVYYENNVDSVDYYIDNAFNLSIKISYYEGIVNSILEKAQLARNRGQYDIATGNYLYLLNVAEKNNDKKTVLNVYVRLAYLYYSIKDVEPAYMYARKALAVSKQIGDFDIWNAYNVMGLAFKNDNKLDSAIYYFNLSQKLATEASSKKGILYSTGNISTILIKRKEYDKAIKELTKVHDIALELNDYKSIANIYENFSYIYQEYNKEASELNMKKKYTNLAIKNALKSLQYAEKIQSVEFMRKAYDKLFTAYKEINNYEKALFYADKAIIIQDSVSRLKSSNAEQDLKYKQKLQDTEDEQQAQINLIRKQEIIIIIIYSASAVIFIFIALLFLFFYKTRQNTKLLNAINSEINEKNKAIIAKGLEFKKLNSELEIANNTKNQFLSILAHDLKNPFNTMIGFSDIIKEQVEKGEYNEVVKYSEILQETGKSTYDLLENLFNWAKFQRNMIKCNPQAINIYNIVNEAVEHLKPNIKDKGIIFHNKTQHELTLYADKFMFSTIIRNLVYNAIKYTNEGGSITVSSDTVKEDVTNIYVSDTGIGISDEDLPNIFRVDIVSRIGTKSEKGTGLGLLLCQEFTLKLGGDIDLTSKKGEGTTFTLSFKKTEKE